jgi:hypothetical protein
MTNRRAQLGIVAIVMAVTCLLAASRAEAQCGPGAHWVDTCGAGVDNMTSTALVGLDTDVDGNLDGQVDENLILQGPVSVNRAAAAASTAQCGSGPGGHAGPDVIDTEIVSMSLTPGGTGGSPQLQAGIGQGGITGNSRGCVIETSTSNAGAYSYFDVFFKLTHPTEGPLFNVTALRIGAAVPDDPPLLTELPPKGAGYYHVITTPIPLYANAAGTGPVIARLVTAQHVIPLGSPAFSSKWVVFATVLLVLTAITVLVVRRGGLATA